MHLTLVKGADIVYLQVRPPWMQKQTIAYQYFFFKRHTFSPNQVPITWVLSQLSCGRQAPWIWKSKKKIQSWKCKFDFQIDLFSRSNFVPLSNCFSIIELFFQNLKSEFFFHSLETWHPLFASGTFVEVKAEKKKKEKIENKSFLFTLP